MERKKDNYHVRPYPQQPKRFNQQLVATLDDLETTLVEKVPNLESIRDIQAKMHASLANSNDDQLVDQVRQLSTMIDQYQQKPTKAVLQKIVRQILKVRIALKHLH